MANRVDGEGYGGRCEDGQWQTCGFLLPAFARIIEQAPSPKSNSKWEPARPRVLVLAPTRELAQQIGREAEKFAPVARAVIVTVYGGVPKGDQIRQLRKGADMLIATPGRVLDFSTSDHSKGPP